MDSTDKSLNQIRLKELQNELLSIAIDFDKFCKKHEIQYYLMGGSALGAYRHKGFIPWDDDYDVFMTYDNYLKFLECSPQKFNPKKYYIQKENTADWPMFYTKVKKNGTTYLEENYEQFVSKHHGIFIDIFCLNNVSNNFITRRIQFLAAKMLTAKALIKRGGYNTSSTKKKFFMKFSDHIISERIQNKILQWFRRYEKKSTNYVALLFGAVGYKRATLPIEILGSPRYLDFESTKLPVPSDIKKYLHIAFGDYNKLPSIDEIENSRHNLMWDSKNDYTNYIKSDKNGGC